jgi:hypothetical protein
LEFTPVALVDEWVWVMKPDTKAVIDKMAQVEYDVWDVREYVSVLVDWRLVACGV